MVVNKEILSEELIKPSSPTPHDRKELKLSFLDQLAGPTFIPHIFFYQSQSSNLDHAKSSHDLKQSLSEVLTIFYPLAGRIKGNIYINCNDSGALVVEVQVQSVLLEAIQNTAIEELNQFLPLEPYAILDPKINLPLAVQINYFQCGGIAIGVCMSHKIADGMSFVTFMNAWAATCRHKPELIVQLQPSFDIGGQLFPQVEEDSPFPPFRRNGEKEKLVTKRFVFDKEKLEALKTQLGMNPTRVEAVSAFIWKHIIGVSSPVKSDGCTKTSMPAAFHSANLRTRMSLPISKGFVFGNFSVLTPPALSMSNQEGQDYDGLVWLLRTAIGKIDNDYIKNIQSGVPYLNAINNAVKMLCEEEIVGFSSCLFTSWCRFPVYEVDYGWGKPLLVCTVAVPRNKTVFLMNTRSGDGIEAWICMLEDEMAMLPDELLSLASNCIWT